MACSNINDLGSVVQGSKLVVGWSFDAHSHGAMSTVTVRVKNARTKAYAVSAGVGTVVDSTNAEYTVDTTSVTPGEYLVQADIVWADGFKMTTDEQRLRVKPRV